MLSDHIWLRVGLGITDPGFKVASHTLHILTLNIACHLELFNSKYLTNNNMVKIIIICCYRFYKYKHVVD